MSGDRAHSQNPNPGLHRAAPGSRQQQRSGQRDRRRGQARRQMMVSVAVVAILAALGGYALLATKAKPAGAQAASNRQPPNGGQARPVASGNAAQPAAGSRKSPSTVTITWVGDMTFGTVSDYPADGSASLLTGVRKDLRSSLTIGNLETALGTLPLAKCAAHEQNCYAFEAPDNTAEALRHAGFSAVNVANNHTLDAGVAGEQDTDDALRAAGLAWTGRPGQITYLMRRGIKIALLGFAPWSYDADMLNIQAASAMVRAARAHAKIVIVIIHAGSEGAGAQHVPSGEEYFLGEDRGNSVAFTHAMIDAGADLVVGSGPHVLRGMQWYHGHLIAYSLGNFCGYNTLGLGGVTSVSAILHITLTADGRFVRGSIAPIQLVPPGTPQPDPSAAAIGLINSLSQQDFSGNGAVRISATGRLHKPRP